MTGLRSFRGALVACHVDAERNDGDAALRNAQQLRHHRDIPLADGHETVDVLHLPPNELDRPRSIGLDEAREKQVFALERAAHGPLQRLAQRPRQADEERVRKVHDVGHRLAGDPLEKLRELLPEHAAVPFEHRDHEIAEQLRIGGQRSAGERVDDGRRIPQSIQEPRRLPEQRQVLLQVDADSTEEHPIAAHVGLVGCRRRVKRNQGHVVTALKQFDGQPVIAGTTPAIHAGGSRGDRENFHSSAVWKARARNRKSMRLPSCGWSQFSWIVGTGPRFKRST